jgi:hypothetical protein
MSDTITTICWDIDDVLNSLMREWLRYEQSKERVNHYMPYSDLTENPPHHLLGWSLAEYRASLDEFRIKNDTSLAPNTEILRWMVNTGACFRHVAVTSRPIHAVPTIAQWLFRHFGACIHTFSVAPSPSRGGVESKLDFVQRNYPGSILVDDDPNNLLPTSPIPMEFPVLTVLYPQPWNQSQWTVSHLLQTLHGMRKTA